jgi:integrase
VRIYRRGAVYYGVYWQSGQRVRRSTGCHDKKAAEAVVRQWERDAADPGHAAARDATLSTVINNYCVAAESGTRARRIARSTEKSYRTKLGHLIRLLEHEADRYQPLALALLEARRVHAYITQRRSEGVSDHTIHKELVALRAVLRQAREDGLWRGEIDAVIPRNFSRNYRPRSRFLTEDEAERLLGELRDDRAAVVAFMIATGAEWSAVQRARRGDVASDRGSVLLRGTKNLHRQRKVPIESDAQRRLLAFALAHANGHEELLFDDWTNVRRDIHAACRRAGIAPCSPHDLRRTFASWMVRLGVPPYLIGKMLGHTSSKMAETIYAQLRPEDLAGLVRGAISRNGNQRAA